MENYEQEIAFLKSIGNNTESNPNYDLAIQTLAEFKAYLIEQGKKGKLTKEEIWNDVFESLTSHTENFSWYVFKSMGIYANQFIYDDELGTATNDMLKNRIKELEKEGQQHRDNQFIPGSPAEQWIEIKSYKDLPKKLEHVMVFGRYTKDCPKRVYQAIFDPKRGKFYSKGTLSKDVNHWRPLPAAPESTTSTKQP